MRLAWDARLKAEKHHRISMAALHLARHHESEAKERWEHAQEVMSKAHTKLTAATSAHHTAHHVHEVAEKIDHAMEHLRVEALAWYKKTVKFKDAAIAKHLKMKLIHEHAHAHMEKTAASRRHAH